MSDWKIFIFDENFIIDRVFVDKFFSSTTRFRIPFKENSTNVDNNYESIRLFSQEITFQFRFEKEYWIQRGIILGRRKKSHRDSQRLATNILEIN